MDNASPRLGVSLWAEPVSVLALHHCTIRCTPLELDGLGAFYTQVLGLEPGPRPDLPVPGLWLYAGGHPIVHLYATLEGADSRIPEATTGSLDHVSFRADDLVATRRHLRSQGIDFVEAPIAGWPIHQLFLRDPMGLKIELTFFGDPTNA
jgi:catechol 2,3-dioxygenase-like lactoylglutathione lyase family enzyme